MRLLDPLEELQSLRREIDRAFTGIRPGNLLRNTFLPGRSPRQYPLMNISESEDAFEVEALAPGLDPTTFQVTVLGTKLTISGEKPENDPGITPEKYHRHERAAGKFTRTFTLGTDIQADRVTAEYRHGILKVHLPKREDAKPRRIAVTVNAA